MIMNENQTVQNKAPCRNCEERHATCHSECERYITWKAAHEQNKHLNARDYEANKLFATKKRRYKEI